MSKSRGKDQSSAQTNADQEALDSTDQNDGLNKDAWLNSYQSSTARSNRWFYIGVSVFAGMIGIMWLIGIDVQIKELTKRRSQETSLVQETKSSWEKIFSERDKKAASLNIKQALSQALNAIATRPAPTTSTSATTTPTTSTIYVERFTGSNDAASTTEFTKKTTTTKK